MQTVKIHRHIEGPFESGDDSWYNLCLVEYEDGEIGVSEIFFEDLASATDAKDTLQTTLYILEAEADVCSTMTLN